jgi:exopolyphosphatase/guanosine-5'-triphosphate,3'-diphosphate pyrophosphatase
MSKSPSQKTEIKAKIILDTAKTLINESNSDLHHAEQVTKLSLALFDKLVEIHDMGSRERLLFEVAAMLHDIGWSRTINGGHHKHSRDMILETELPEITDRERNICALIARYHNKAEPDASRHKSYAALEKGDRLIVSWLAAILRVADGLDCLHNNKVSIAGCKIDKKRLTILLSADGDCSGEIRGARRKSGLLERMSRRDLVFQPCS